MIVDISYIETQNPKTFGVVDLTQYSVGFTPVNTILTVETNGFLPVDINFTPSSLNIINSNILELTPNGTALIELPDGVYKLTYKFNPIQTNNVTITVMRVNKIWEKFDTAYLKTDITECNEKIKLQQKEELDEIERFINGAIAAANKCAVEKANELYRYADRLLNNFIKEKCNHC